MASSKDDRNEKRDIHDFMPGNQEYPFGQAYPIEFIYKKNKGTGDNNNRDKL